MTMAIRKCPVTLNSSFVDADVEGGNDGGDGDAKDDNGVDNDLSLVLEHLKLLIVCLDFGLQGRHYSLGHPELQVSESLEKFSESLMF